MNPIGLAAAIIDQDSPFTGTIRAPGSSPFVEKIDHMFSSPVAADSLQTFLAQSVTGREAGL
jgi:phosphoribosyl 1,2-cyclic phosphodiesterase